MFLCRDALTRAGYWIFMSALNIIFTVVFESPLPVLYFITNHNPIGRNRRRVWPFHWYVGVDDWFPVSRCMFSKGGVTRCLSIIRAAQVSSSMSRPLINLNKDTLTRMTRILPNITSTAIMPRSLTKKLFSDGNCPVAHGGYRLSGFWSREFLSCKSDDQD